MRVEQLSLSNFRNYTEQMVTFDPAVNVICGSNAQGKTNLLEAVYLLSGIHSFRTRFDKELINFNSNWASVKADICTGSRDKTVQLLLQRGQGRQVTVNGAKKPSKELAEIIKVVLFSPEDLYLIKDGAAVRRHLMDNAICQLRPNYSVVISDFNKFYENKTHILRDGRERPSLLSTLDEFSAGLARCSARIIRYRASFAERLAEVAAPIHQKFSGGKEELSIVYKTVSTVTDPHAAATTIYEQIMAHQQAHKQAELETGQCLTGAHKDDLEIFINGIPARSFASQGQARTAALSIKLAEWEIFQVETGEFPVLLLDDVLSELDGVRQEFVLNQINGGQTLITCCEDEGIVRRTGGKVIRVHDGCIK